MSRFKNNGQNFQIHLRTTNHQEKQSSPSKQTRGRSSEGRILRKNRDVMQLQSKPVSIQVNGFVEVAPKGPTVLDLLLKSVQDKDGHDVLCKKFFKLGDKEILVSFHKTRN